MQIERGIIRRFDPAVWRADVEILGGHTALLPGVPVSAALGPDLLAPGTRVWVCLSGEGNPADGAVLAPYGAAPAPWVTSRLWKPTVATAERNGVLACSSTTYVAVSDLSITVGLEATGTVLLLLAAIGYLSTGGINYVLSFFHEDEHETTQLTPVETVGGSGSAANETWSLGWLALQSGVAAGTHTFVLKHRVSGGQANLQRGRVVAVVCGGA